MLPAGDHRLRRTIATLGAQELPAGETLELVLVFNRPAQPGDEIPAVGVLARVTTLHEPRPGKSRAANFALAHVRSELVLWVDDDLDYDPRWAAALAGALRADPGSAVTGVVSLPAELRPAWMAPCHRAAFGEVPPTAGPIESLLGGCMGFPLAAARLVPGFDPALGPGSALGSYEDILYTRMLRAAGIALRCVPEARAVHHFSAARLAAGPLWQASCRGGRSLAYVHHHWDHQDALATFRMRAAVLGGCLKHHLRAGPGRLLSRRTAGVWKLGFWSSYYLQMRVLRGTPRRYRRTAPFLVK